MSFAERNGFIAEKAIQINSIDDSLRSRLHNLITLIFNSLSNKEKMLIHILDKLGYDIAMNTGQQNLSMFHDLFKEHTHKKPWYLPYEIVELVLEYIQNADLFFEYNPKKYSIYCKAINQILEEEKSGYRIIEGKLVNIVSEEEIESINTSTNTTFESVNKHIKKALAFYADRKNPDYENSVKESISAVEAMCCIITGSKGSQATLGNTIKKLTDHGISIHSAMQSAFSSLYGYTSDSSGIRHGGINFTSVSQEDAKYMLVSCSAFVNYLIEKYAQIGGTTHDQNETTNT